MAQKPVAKVSMSLDPILWQAFRIACLQHQISASQMITLLMTAQLEKWREERKETPHA
jgi:hypothetical protein